MMDWFEELIVKVKRLVMTALVLIISLSACTPTTATRTPSNYPIPVTILYANDEHGWLLPAETSKTMLSSGAAEMMGLWEKNEGYPNASTIVLSGGDMWTGPAISTWFKGESTAEAMNAMGYRAAALGNHDFDFGLDVLKQRRAASKFPFVAANITAKDGKPVDFADPYALLNVSGIKVGVIGLSTRATPSVTKRENVSGLDFGDYEAALRKYVPQVRSQGASVILVVAHVCISDLAALTRQVKDLNIPVMFGGHCHEADNEQVGDTWIVESGAFLRAYSRVDMKVDTAAKQVSDVQVKLVKVEWTQSAGPPAPPDTTVEAIVDKWKVKADAELGRVIGYTKNGIALPWPMYNMVTDAWLWAYPQADIVLLNVGSFRQNIDVGDITLGTIVSTMPVEYTIYDLKLTGAQILEDLKCCGGVATSGIKLADGKVILAKTGQPIDPQATYRVLVTDYMYTGGDGFPLQKQDPNGYDTAIIWRQPVIDWLIEQNSSASSPIDSKIDAESRGTSSR
jgi:5'-nucleotidase/UDP-sugar diphosphatase